MLRVVDDHTMTYGDVMHCVFFPFILDFKFVGRTSRGHRLAKPNSQTRTGTGEYSVSCSADHEQDWQPYPVDPYSAICDDHTYIYIYTTGGRSHRIFHPPSFCGACLNFSREKDSAINDSFPSSTV